jgi:hypothetical protein
MSLIGEGMEILNLINKAQNAELYKQIGEWIDKVEKLQLRVDQLSDENKVLKEEVRFKGILERINGHTFLQGDDDEICPGCAEANSKPIHLIPHHSKHAPFQKAWCPKCQTEFQHNVPYSRDLASQVRRTGSVL